MGSLLPSQIDFSLDLVRPKNSFPCLLLDTDLPTKATYLKELGRQNESMRGWRNAVGIHSPFPSRMMILNQNPLMEVLCE